MSRIRFAFAISLMTMYACSTQTSENKVESDLPSFEMKTFRVESKGGCEEEMTSCAYYSVTYPEFNGLSALALQALHERISEVMQIGDPATTSLSFDSAGTKFIRDYERFSGEFPESAMGWNFQGEIKVDSISNTLISMVATTQYFTGGAHGGRGTYFINIDPVTGKKITLDDILKTGYKEPLRQIGETQFNGKYVQSDSTAVSDFQFEDDKFQLNDNYGILKDGIKFFYNIYEIAPYAAGTQEISIPYQDIKAWMK